MWKTAALSSERPICSFLLGRALRSASCGLEDKARSAGVGALDYGLNVLVAPVIRHRQDLRRCGLRSGVMVCAGAVQDLAETEENVGGVGQWPRPVRSRAVAARPPHNPVRETADLRDGTRVRVDRIGSVDSGC